MIGIIIGVVVTIIVIVCAIVPFYLKRNHDKVLKEEASKTSWDKYDINGNLKV